MLKALAHPDVVYRREASRLRLIGARHWIAIALGLLGLSMLLCAMPLAATGAGGVYPIPFGLFSAQESLKQVACLMAATLAAASIRREERLITLLRLAGRSTQGIALSKLCAVLRRLWLPISLVIALRLGFIAVEVLMPFRSGFYIWKAIAGWAPPMRAMLRTVPLIQWLSALMDGGLLACRSAVSLMTYSRARNLWIVYYLFQPLLDAALFAAAGLAAASKVRGGGRLAAAVGLSGGVTGSGYLFTRVTTQLLTVGYWVVVKRITRSLWRLPELDLAGAAVPGFLLANLWLTGMPVVVAGPTRPITQIVIGLMLIAKAGLVWLMVRAAGRNLAEG